MEWISGSNKIYTFEMFSRSHLVILGIFLFITIFLFLYRKKMSGDKWRKIEMGAAISLLFSEAANQTWMISNSIWKASHSLPLELCNISLFLSIILLLTRKRIFFEILFFLSLLGAVQAIVTPGLTYGFPHFRFFHYFFAHMSVVWIALYFTWAKGYFPTFQSVIKLMVFINLLLPVILFINKRFDGNYWFLRHKPNSPSFFDILGPYPYYIFTLESLLLLISFIAWRRHRDFSFKKILLMFNRTCASMKFLLFFLLRIKNKETQNLGNKS